MVMRVLKPRSKIGLPIAPIPLFAQLIVLGSPYGLDASCIRCTRFGNSDGADPRALHLLHEPDGHRPDLAGPGHRQTERRHPHAADEIRRLNLTSFSLSTTCSRLLHSFS